MPSFVKFVFRDYSDETSLAEFTLDQGTAGNFDALVTQKNAIRTALQGITLGNIDHETFIAQKNDVDNGPAGTPTAQREMKWLLEFIDDVSGGRFQREIPTADIVTAGLLVANTDIADLSAAEWVAMKAAVDNIVRSNMTGNTATLVGARLVGRNL